MDMDNDKGEEKHGGGAGLVEMGEVHRKRQSKGGQERGPIKLKERTVYHSICHENSI